MAKTKLNAATEELVRIDADKHPAFTRLWQNTDFSRIRENNFPAFKQIEGLSLLCLVDDPNMYKETFDMIVIGPEIAKLFGDTLSAKGFTDPSFGRTIATMLGIHRLPAIAIFRNGEMMGAIEGLKNWTEYEQELVAILTRDNAPKKTIAISAR